MSLKRIRRRLSQTFRFSIEGSLSELAEHLTIEDGAEVKENGKSSYCLSFHVLGFQQFRICYQNICVFQVYMCYRLSQSLEENYHHLTLGS